MGEKMKKRLYIYPLPHFRHNPTNLKQFLSCVNGCLQMYGILNLYSRVHTVAQIAYQLLHVCPSVLLSACISPAPTEEVFVKFDVGDFWECLQRKPKIFEIREKSGTLLEYPSMFYCCRRLQLTIKAPSSRKMLLAISRPSIRPSVLVRVCVSVTKNWTDICEILYWRLLLKSIE